MGEHSSVEPCWILGFHLTRVENIVNWCTKPTDRISIRLKWGGFESISCSMLAAEMQMTGLPSATLLHGFGALPNECVRVELLQDAETNAPPLHCFQVIAPSQLATTKKVSLTHSKTGCANLVMSGMVWRTARSTKPEDQAIAGKPQREAWDVEESRGSMPGHGADCASKLVADMVNSHLVSPEQSVPVTGHSNLALGQVPAHSHFAASNGQAKERHKDVMNRACGQPDLLQPPPLPVGKVDSAATANAMEPLEAPNHAEAFPHADEVFEKFLLGVPNASKELDLILAAAECSAEGAFGPQHVSKCRAAGIDQTTSDKEDSVTAMDAADSKASCSCDADEVDKVPKLPFGRMHSNNSLNPALNGCLAAPSLVLEESVEQKAIASAVPSLAMDCGPRSASRPGRGKTVCFEVLSDDNVTVHSFKAERKADRQSSNVPRSAGASQHLSKQTGSQAYASIASHTSVTDVSSSGKLATAVKMQEESSDVQRMVGSKAVPVHRRVHDEGEGPNFSTRDVAVEGLELKTKFEATLEHKSTSECTDFLGGHLAGMRTSMDFSSLDVSGLQESSTDREDVAAVASYDRDSETLDLTPLRQRAKSAAAVVSTFEQESASLAEAAPPRRKTESALATGQWSRTRSLERRQQLLKISTDLSSTEQEALCENIELMDAVANGEELSEALCKASEVLVLERRTSIVLLEEARRLAAQLESVADAQAQQAGIELNTVASQAPSLVNGSRQKSHIPAFENGPLDVASLRKLGQVGTSLYDEQALAAATEAPSEQEQFDILSRLDHMSTLHQASENLRILHSLHTAHDNLQEHNKKLFQSLQQCRGYVASTSDTSKAARSPLVNSRRTFGQLFRS